MEKKVKRKGTARSQNELPFRSWGGARKGAGRPSKSERSRVRHTKRERFPSRYPQHIVLRVRTEILSLRSDALFQGIRERLGIAAERLGMRIIEFSVLGNHIHLIVESEGHESLERAVKGLTVRLARFINKVMRRRGPVFDDRYHVTILKTPRQVRHALVYVLENRRKDLLLAGRTLPPSWLDPCSSAPWFDGWLNRKPAPLGRVTAHAKVWLLTHGWKRHGLLRIGEVASVKRR